MMVSVLDWFIPALLYKNTTEHVKSKALKQKLVEFESAFLFKMLKTCINK